MLSSTVLRIRDVYPVSWFLPIPDLGSRIQKQQQKRGVKKISCHTFFCNHKFHKIEHYLIFEILNKKFLANFQRIIELSTQKSVTMLSKIWVWDPGSRVKKAPDPGSGSATLVKYGALGIGPYLPYNILKYWTFLMKFLRPLINSKNPDPGAI
jgi:hypothetical protein